MAKRAVRDRVDKRGAKKKTMAPAAPTEGGFASLGDPTAHTVSGAESQQSVREAPTPPLFRR